MSSERPPRDPLFMTRLTIGMWIIALGLIFLAGNLGWIDSHRTFGLFWPLLLVLAGVNMLAKGPALPADHPGATLLIGRKRRWGWLLIGVGAWLFLNKLGWFSVSLWQLAFPALLLSIGGLLVWRAFAPTPRTELPPGMTEDHAEYVRAFTIMSGSELRPVSRPFRGADLTAMMAGIKLDLTDAKMEGDTATIELFAFWGGLEIFVPRDWTVVTKVGTVMGGFNDKRRPTSATPTKTLIITGFIVMSGVEVKD